MSDIGLKFIPVEGEGERKKQLRIIQRNLIIQYNNMYYALKQLQNKRAIHPFEIESEVLKTIQKHNTTIHRMCTILKTYISTFAMTQKNKDKFYKNVQILQSGMFLFTLHIVLYNHYRFSNYDRYNCLLNEGHLGRNCANTALLLYLYGLSFPEYRIQFCLTEQHMAIGISVNNVITHVVDYGDEPQISHRVAFSSQFYDFITNAFDDHPLYQTMYNDFATMLNNSRQTPFICNRIYDARRNYIIASNQIHSPLMRYAMHHNRIRDVYPTLIYFNKTLLGDDKKLSETDEMDAIHSLYKMYNQITTYIFHDVMDRPEYKNQIVKFVKLFNQTFFVHFNVDYITNMVFFIDVFQERQPAFIDSSSTSHEDEHPSTSPAPPQRPVSALDSRQPSKRALQAINAAKKRVMERDDRPDATKTRKSS